MWLHSLRWLGQGIEAAAKGDRKALTHVMAIIQDWVRDNPYSWKGDVGAWESTMHRTNVLLCARQAVLAGSVIRSLPPQYAWLDQTLLDHAKFMTENWGGPSNHGTDESIALFGVGCTLKRPELKSLAPHRLTEAITTAIDPQDRDERAVGRVRPCSTTPALGPCDHGAAAVRLQPGPGHRRTTRRAGGLALATKSTGELQQVGDAIRQDNGRAPASPGVRRHPWTARSPADPADRGLRRRLRVRPDRGGVRPGRSRRSRRTASGSVQAAGTTGTTTTCRSPTPRTAGTS